MKSIDITNKTPTFVDQLLHCVACGADWIFEAGQAKHFFYCGMREDGAPWADPIRCPSCRRVRGALRQRPIQRSNHWRSEVKR